jgi:hypothetical protein
MIASAARRDRALLREASTQRSARTCFPCMYPTLTTLGPLSRVRSCLVNDLFEVLLRGISKDRQVFSAYKVGDLLLRSSVQCGRGRRWRDAMVKPESRKLLLANFQPRVSRAATSAAANEYRL